MGWVVVARGVKGVQEVVRVGSGHVRLEEIIDVGIGFRTGRILLLHLERAAGHDQKNVKRILQAAGFVLVLAIHPPGIGADRVHDHFAHHAIAACNFDG